MTEAALADLPSWDLTDLYAGPEAPELEADFVAAEGAAKAFREAHQGRLAAHDGAALAEAVQEYERIDELVSRIMSFAFLNYAADMSATAAGRFLQNARERANAISNDLIFFGLELNRIGETTLAAQLAEPALARYEPWLDQLRAFRPHQLDDEMETLLNDLGVVGASAWMRLFDESVARLRFTIDGEEMTSSEALNLLSDRDGTKRKAAAKEIGRVFGENIEQFSLITNTLAKEKEILDRWRDFAGPVSARNLSNQVEDEVVEALVSAVSEAYPRLSHRYYALKAKWFGVEALDYWDRNAPLPSVAERSYSWKDATETVLNAYGSFSPQLAEVARPFFDNAWIDVPVRPGKSPGAFAHPTVPGAHPYLLLNYQGKPRDVMTLAHELGHGVHQVLAADQGHLLSDTPLTVAETASVFGEMLTFRAMLDAEPDQAKRKALLASKVEDMINTVVRQIAFFQFELKLHNARAQGELSAEDIGEIWMSVQRESLGPAIRFEDEYRHYWSYIPHFIHSPFYVYAYAFGDCLVNSLYAVYEQAESGFQDKYFALLRAGGSQRHQELLAPFGLDASDPAFWNKGLEVIAGLIDELEAMD